MVTLVFTDVEGSTRLLRELGPRFGEFLGAHNQILARAMSAHGGTIVRTEGDSFFCAFEDPARALTACVEAQRGLAEFPWPDGAAFKVRIGLHTGPVEVAGYDYIGLAVHQAARVSDAAHGGQTLISEASRQLLGDHAPGGVVFTRLGQYRLKDFGEPTLLYQADHPSLPSAFPSVRALPAAAHNVPEQATMFVGRQTALNELAEQLARHRLVTVTGAGGVGKTRLATEAVPLVVPSFPDGVWMVELGKLRDGQAVAGEIAATLSVRVETERSIEQLLVEALQSKRILLLLDNCEHVLDELAPLVESVVSSCPHVHVLATSREPLALHGERRFPLAPLTVPGGGLDAEGSEAVALFVDRAKIVAPGFDIARERDAVVEICRRLDGLPLAIELAAARTAAISPGRMAARLDRRFSVLRRSYRGSLPHHETLRASIEWSYELLDPEERVLLVRLSVFTGEFDLEAAEEVCGREPLEADDVLELLARLIEKSLVQPVGERYLLLESIREFGREQLQAVGEVEAMIAAHIDFYTALVEQAAREAAGPDQRTAYDRLDLELPNIRAAVQRALERAMPAALRLSAPLAQFGFIRNRLREVAQWCIDAAAIPGAPAGLRARALSQAGFALVMMGSPDGGQALVDDGLELARASGEPLLVAETLLMSADLRLEAGSDEEARPLAEEAVAVVRAVGNDLLLGQALLIAARADYESLGAVCIAERLLAAEDVFERSGDRRLVARALLTRAYLWLEAGELDAASRDAQACREVCRELDHTIGEAMAGTVRVWVAIETGQVDAARADLDTYLAVARDCNYQSLLAYCLSAEAALRAHAGEHERAARLLGALAGASPVLGGEGARAITSRMRTLRAELETCLGAELPRLLAEGERTPLLELAVALA